MPSYTDATVVSIDVERAGLQRVSVARDDRDGVERAYVLTQLIGPVTLGDDVIINTTAVDLELGTGGWHPVVWNLSRRKWSFPGTGHVMKLRYAPNQSDTGVFEEFSGGDVRPALDGMPVIVGVLHSQAAIAATVVKHLRPELEVAYVMSDQGSLPFALSDVMAELVDKRIVDQTFSAGQAFGAQTECVNVPSALAIARAKGADVVIVAQGPGVVGTGTALGFSGLEAAANLNSAGVLGGRPIFALRYSDADKRERHQGISHHSFAVLGHCSVEALIGLPPAMGSVKSQLEVTSHTIIETESLDLETVFQAADVKLTSMGRGLAEDSGFFAFSAAAGQLGARLARSHLI